VDEVRLEGSLNVELAATVRSALFAEVRRVLRPGGKVIVHGLVADRPFPDKPALPGLAALVQYVPVEADVAQWLRDAGFVGLFYEKLGDIHCFDAGAVELREMRLIGQQPGTAPGTRQVLYKGPLRCVRDEHGTEYPRGVRVMVAADVAEQLRHGPAAEQIAFLVE
jgi:hypothetical protein